MLRLSLAASFAALVAACSLPSSQTAGNPVVVATEQGKPVRQLALYGVHLGVTPQAARAALLAQGFSQAEDGGQFTRDFETIYPRFTEAQNSSVLWSLSYRKHVNPTDFAGENDRINHLRALFGEPTRWSVRRYALGNDVDAIYAPSSNDITSLSNNITQSCFFDWPCVSMKERVDCRPIVAKFRSPVIEATFRSDGALTIEFTDFDLLARELMSERDFVQKDLTSASCLAPSVH